MTKSTWYPSGVESTWLDRLHGFNWLDDLRASNDTNARNTARALTARWVADHRRYQLKSWHPVVVATRLTQWMAHFDFLSSTADPTLQRIVLQSAAQQYAFLKRTVPGRLSGSELIRCLKALIIVGLCLPGSGVAITVALRNLETTLYKQVGEDGSYQERSPQSQMRVLLDLLDIRAALVLGGSEIPNWLNTALSRLAGSARQLLQGDGRLARFQGEPLLSSKLIQEALERADGGKTPAAGKIGNAGFHRFRAGRTLLLVDAGIPKGKPGPSGIHAGTLAFELSIGSVRLVTNCGNFDVGSEWQQLQRTTAAHSTLTWDNRNSSDLFPDGQIGRHPTQVQSRQIEDSSGYHISLSHNGYADIGGGTHYRTLSLRYDGLVLSGEDRLEGNDHGTPVVRFHLNPGVSAEITQTRRTALIRLSARERGWRFDAQGALLQISDSVVASEVGEPLRSQQLILSPQYDGLEPEDCAMKWRFSQEGSTR